MVLEEVDLVVGAVIVIWVNGCVVANRGYAQICTCEMYAVQSLKYIRG